MPDSVFPSDSLHNLQIYFDVSVFPVTARFKVCFHQHGSISLPSKCEENLPVVCVRAGLGTGFVQVSGAGMATSGGGVELLSCAACAGKVLQAALPRECYVHSVWSLQMDFDIFLQNINGSSRHKELFFSPAERRSQFSKVLYQLCKNKDTRQYK